MPMSDDELRQFLGLPQCVGDDYVQRLTPAARAMYDKMKQIIDWDAGKGPLPSGVIVKLVKKTGHGHA